MLAFIVDKQNLNSVATLTGALEVDARAQHVDLRFVWRDEDLLPRLRALVAGQPRLAVALSFATAQWPEMADLLGQLDGLEPRPRLWAGGPHPSARPGDVLAAGADAVVVGEGEEALPALLAHLEAGESPLGLPGVAALDAGGQLVRGPRRPAVDLDAYPPFGIQHRRFGPVEITRGCPCACGFCQTSFLFGGRMRHRSVER
ncbi:MAG: cobalamin-dependent protein, partial [Anaerolineae bacterium]